MARGPGSRRGVRQQTFQHQAPRGLGPQAPNPQQQQQQQYQQQQYQQQQQQYQQQPQQYQQQPIMITPMHQNQPGIVQHPNQSQYTQIQNVQPIGQAQRPGMMPNRPHIMLQSVQMPMRISQPQMQQQQYQQQPIMITPMHQNQPGIVQQPIQGQYAQIQNVQPIGQTQRPGMMPNRPHIMLQSAQMPMRISQPQMQQQQQQQQKQQQIQIVQMGNKKRAKEGVDEVEAGVAVVGPVQGQVQELVDGKETNKTKVIVLEIDQLKESLIAALERNKNKHFFSHTLHRTFGPALALIDH